MNEIKTSAAFDSSSEHRPAGHPKALHGRIGVLLLNLGTPDGTDYWSMRRYLKEFLSDERVIEVPRWKWWPILNLIILTVRPGRKGKDYATIWNNELDEGPLKTITRNQAEKLQAAFSNDPRVEIDWAMRYANPTTGSAIRALLDKGCDRILLMPLYPQYAAATSATACDHAFRTLMEMRWQPAVRTLPPYYDDAAYIDALEEDLVAQVAALDFVPEVVLLSYHGMPERTLHLGDPYHCHCRKTSRLLLERLQHRLPGVRIETSFQSRFGRAKWLEPATETVLAAEAASGTRRLAIAAPGFSADCVETLEELAIRGREVFAEAGGERYAVLACLNDREPGMTMLETLVRRELGGW